MNDVSSRNEPRAACLTGAGRGAVATVRIHHFSIDADEGTTDDAAVLFQSASGRPLSAAPMNKIIFGYWGRVREEVVACRLDDSTVELHCHGGRAAVNRILNDLESSGCSVVSAEELTNENSIWQREFASALIHGLTWRTTRLLLQQPALWADWLDQLTASADADFWRNSIQQPLRFADVGLHLTQPWRVVLAGRPNVGKSSLINALAGFQRAIVFDEPGTTRDVVTVDTAFDGWPVRLSDTAGIRKTTAELESAGIEKSKQELQTADLRVLVFDGSTPLTSADVEFANRCRQEFGSRLLIIRNKSDLPRAWGGDSFPIDIGVSCETRDGLEELMSRIVDRLIPADLQGSEDAVAFPVVSDQVARLQLALQKLESDGIPAAKAILFPSSDPDASGRSL